MMIANGPEDFAVTVKTEMAKWGKRFREARLKDEAL